MRRCSTVRRPTAGEVGRDRRSPARPRGTSGGPLFVAGAATGSGFAGRLSHGTAPDACVTACEIFTRSQLAAEDAVRWGRASSGADGDVPGIVSTAPAAALLLLGFIPGAGQLRLRPARHGPGRPGLRLARPARRASADDAAHGLLGCLRREGRLGQQRRGTPAILRNYRRLRAATPPASAPYAAEGRITKVNPPRCSGAVHGEPRRPLVGHHAAARTAFDETDVRCRPEVRLALRTRICAPSPGPAHLLSAAQLNRAGQSAAARPTPPHLR